MIGFVVDDGIDVDTMKDMGQLERIFKDVDFPILSFLKENYLKLEEIGI